MEKILIKPASNMIVRDPETMEPLPESGKLVEQNSYWLRRIQNGDAFVEKPATIKKKVKEKRHAD